MVVKTILKAKARGVGVVSIGPEATLVEATRLLAANRIGALIVVDATGAIAGILSERDIVRAISTDADASLTKRVRDYMTADVLTCTETDSIESLMQTMTTRRIRHLPVVDQSGHLVGMVTIGDVVKSRLEMASMEAESLREYVMAAR
jgi:CBS domain-containing protein